MAAIIPRDLRDPKFDRAALYMCDTENSMRKISYEYFRISYA